MTTKANKNSPLTQALLETANDMHNVGILGNDAYEKITMLHYKPVLLAGCITAHHGCTANNKLCSMVL